MNSPPAKSSEELRKNGCRRWAAIVLAAGTGKRMKSKLPKPLCPVAGRAMALRVLDSLDQVVLDRIVVVIGHNAKLVRSEIIAKNLNSCPIIFATQKQQLGTGDAALTGLVALEKQLSVTDLVVLNGDMPLLRANTVANLLARHAVDLAEASLLTARLDNPFGYGRILRTADGRIAKIIEESDANAEQKQIQEVNAGAYCFHAEPLEKALSKLQPLNAQSEFYLTDAIDFFVREKRKVSTMTVANSFEVMGVNDAAQLAACERIANRHPD